MHDALHDLVPLNDEFSRLGQPFRLRSFVKRAKDLGLVFKIEKTLFIKQSQTHEVVESLTAYPPTNVRMPSEKPKPTKPVSERWYDLNVRKRITRAIEAEREERERQKRARKRETVKRRRARAKQRAKELKRQRREQKRAARLAAGAEATTAAKQKKPST